MNDRTLRSKNPITTQPRKKRSAILFRLWKYLFRYKWHLLLAGILTLCSNLLALLGPMLSGKAIDAIEPGKGAVIFEEVFLFCGLMVIFYLISSLLSYLLSILMIHLSQKIVYQMRKNVFEKLLELPVSFFDRLQAGEIISRISYDIDTVNASLSNDLLQICTSIITVIGSFISMLFISPPLILVFTVTVPIAVLVTIRRTRKIQPLFKQRSAKLGELSGYMEEMISGTKTIKAYHQEESIINQFDQVNSNAVNAHYRADYYGCTIGPTVNFINNLSLTLISSFGAMLYLLQRISLGDISSFILYSRRFSGPINEMANIISELQSACAAAERVFNLLDQSPEPLDSSDAISLVQPKGEIKFEHVSFGYEADREIIHDFNLAVTPGSLIAIVGPTGAGKTTLINLLMRFYDPNSGRILMDGHDTREITRSSLRAAYTMVLQDTWLFEGTIFDNIAYGKEGATAEEVEFAARSANIHDYIQSLPNGYQTVLTDDGVNLSKGQKQMLTIARAMLSNASILILDEATSNVDTRTEKMIQNAMYRLMEGRTCFVIAHRLSTIQNADQILVIKDGVIAEKGTHQSLLLQGGTYASLYQSQFS